MSQQNLSVKGVVVQILCFSYLIMAGGGTYEQMTISTLMAKDPPHSFAMIQGPYGFSPIKFWITLRPITLLLMLIAIALNFKSTARNSLLLAFLCDVAVIATTFLYFAPQTGVFFDQSITDQVDEHLKAQVILWKNLNYLRLGVMYLCGFFLFKALLASRQSATQLS